jgi:hypothetical protein
MQRSSRPPQERLDGQLQISQGHVLTDLMGATPERSYAVRRAVARAGIKAAVGATSLFLKSPEALQQFVLNRTVLKKQQSVQRSKTKTPTRAQDGRVWDDPGKGCSFTHDVWHRYGPEDDASRAHFYTALVYLLHQIGYDAAPLSVTLGQGTADWEIQHILTGSYEDVAFFIRAGRADPTCLEPDFHIIKKSNPKAYITTEQCPSWCVARGRAQALTQPFLEGLHQDAKSGNLLWMLQVIAERLAVAVRQADPRMLNVFATHSGIGYLPHYQAALAKSVLPHLDPKQLRPAQLFFCLSLYLPMYDKWGSLNAVYQNLNQQAPPASLATNRRRSNEVIVTANPYDDDDDDFYNASEHAFVVNPAIHRPNGPHGYTNQGTNQGMKQAANRPPARPAQQTQMTMGNFGRALFDPQYRAIQGMANYQHAYGGEEQKKAVKVSPSAKPVKVSTKPVKVSAKPVKVSAKPVKASASNAKKTQNTRENNTQDRIMQDFLQAGARLEACQKRSCPAQVRAGETQKRVMAKQMQQVREDVLRGKIKSKEEAMDKMNAVLDAAMTSAATKRLAACTKGHCPKEVRDVQQRMPELIRLACQEGRDTRCVEAFRRITAVYE